MEHSMTDLAFGLGFLIGILVVCLGQHTKDKNQKGTEKE